MADDEDVVIEGEILSPARKIEEQFDMICANRVANYELVCKNRVLTKELDTLKDDYLQLAHLHNNKTEEIAQLKKKLDFHEKLNMNFEKFLKKTHYKHKRKYKSHIRKKSFPVVPFHH